MKDQLSALGAQGNKAEFIEHNQVARTGYNAIAFSGNSSVVRSNYVTDYCNIMDDGSCIYTGGDNLTGRMVHDNICIHDDDTSAMLGTDASTVGVNGIYLDNSSTDVEVYGNTTAFHPTAGIYGHGITNVNIHDNTSYGNDTQILFASSPYVTDMRNNTVVDNIFFAPEGYEVSVVLEATRLVI